MLALMLVLAIMSPVQSDYDTLCRVTAAEARGESLRGQMAVCETIINRSHLWGMTITEAATAKGQYARPYRGEISPLTRQAVFSEMMGQRIFDKPVTHFLSNAAYWERSKKLAGRIGPHKFYY